MDKKGVEQWQFDRFRESLADFPKGDIVVCEEPDFLVVDGSRTIGVELTRVYREVGVAEQPLQEAESLHRRVCERAQSLFRSSSDAAIQVYVTFNSGQRISSKRVDALADFVAITVRSLDPKPDTSFAYGLDIASYDRLPPEITELTGWRLSRVSQTVWQPASAGFVPSLTRAVVEHAVAAKDECFEAYSKKADEVWLLLVADGFAISSMFDTVDPQTIGVLSTRFSCVYFFDAFNRRTVRLHTTPAIA